MGTRSHPEIRGARPAYRMPREYPGPLSSWTAPLRITMGSPPFASPRRADRGTRAQNRAMRSPSRRPLRRGMLIAAALLLLLLHSGAGGAIAQTRDLPSWQWPVSGPREVVEPFRAPAHAYGPGHRGVDIAAAPGAGVLSPADGVVAFRGMVVDRPLLTIDHGGGLVSTFEPLESSLSPGDAVAAGDEIGVVGVGGHTPAGALHIGVRRHGVYINPMLLFGDVPRAVLLPCCEPR